MISISLPGWEALYNSVVLTGLLITQIYLASAIVFAQRRQIKERKLELKKQLELVRKEAEAHVRNGISSSHFDSGDNQHDQTLEG